MQCYEIENDDEMLLLPFQLLIVATEKPTINVPGRNIERLMIPFKVFRNVPHGSALYSDNGVPMRHADPPCAAINRALSFSLFRGQPGLVTSSRGVLRDNILGWVAEILVSFM